MGNTAAVDMGTVIMRGALFDKHDTLFSQVSPEERKQWSYFANDHSFYSPQLEGTFHFFQFNVLQAEQFIASKEFEHFMRFLQAAYSSPAGDIETGQQPAELMDAKLRHLFDLLFHINFDFNLFISIRSFPGVGV